MNRVLSYRQEVAVEPGLSFCCGMDAFPHLLFSAVIKLQRIVRGLMVHSFLGFCTEGFIFCVLSRVLFFDLFCLLGYPGRYLKSLLSWGDYFYVSLCHIAGVHIDQLACVFKQSSLADILNLSRTAFCHTLMYKVLGYVQAKRIIFIIKLQLVFVDFKAFVSLRLYMS